MLPSDRDSGNFACGSGPDAFGTHLVELARVREYAQIERGGFGVVVEPEEWRKLFMAGMLPAMSCGEAWPRRIFLQMKRGIPGWWMATSIICSGTAHPKFCNEES
jgi:hypothetical protein